MDLNLVCYSIIASIVFGQIFFYFRIQLIIFPKKYKLNQCFGKKIVVGVEWTGLANKQNTIISEFVPILSGRWNLRSGVICFLVQYRFGDDLWNYSFFFQMGFTTPQSFTKSILKVIDFPQRNNFTTSSIVIPRNHQCNFDTKLSVTNLNLKPIF